MITRAELLEMKDAEEDKNKKKSRKTKSGSKSPGRRPNSDSKKVNSPDKREKTGSCKLNFSCLHTRIFPPKQLQSIREHAIYGASCLPLVFLNLITCHLSNLRSINSI